MAVRLTMPKQQQTTPTWSPRCPSWFGEGTDKGDTRAKPEIWKEAAKYKEAADKMQAEIVKLNTAAKAGNIDALKVAFGPAAASCKACHDNFRKD